MKEQLALGQDCDGVFYSAALGCRKPDAAFFEQAAILSGFPPGQLLLIDHTPANVTAARTSGWTAIEWTTGRSLSVALPKL